MTSKMTFTENGAINERAFTKENIGEPIYQIDVKDPISVTKSSPSERGDLRIQGLMGRELQRTRTRGVTV